MLKNLKKSLILALAVVFAGVGFLSWKTSADAGDITINDVEIVVASNYNEVIGGLDNFGGMSGADYVAKWPVAGCTDINADNSCDFPWIVAKYTANKTTTLNTSNFVITLTAGHSYTFGVGSKDIVAGQTYGTAVSYKDLRYASAAEMNDDITQVYANGGYAHVNLDGEEYVPYSPVVPSNEPTSDGTVLTPAQTGVKF